ncbi:MAG: YIP1 family protein [Rhodobacteraceae bacterium]|nr:YIP1 family protein [Paracoccaceae bacterium]
MAVEQMHFTLRDLVTHAWETVRNPRAGAERVMGQNVPSQLLWQMLAVVVALSVVLGQGALLLVAGPEDLAGPLVLNPAIMAGLQLAVLVITVYAVHWIGRSMGGTGSFEDTLALMIWLQFIMICLQVVQIAAMMLAQPLADIIGLAGLVLFLWLLTNFVAVLHGFQSLGLVFVMIVASGLGMVFLISLALSLLGITAPGDLNV